jgi:hypothetical protein
MVKTQVDWAIRSQAPVKKGEGSETKWQWVAFN